MGIFNRKGSKVSTDGDSTASITSRHSTALKSPPLKTPSTPNGAQFMSPSLPDVTLPKAPDPKVDPAAYLRSIYAVRERSKYVFEKAKRNKLAHFDVDMSLFGETARYTVSIIKVGYNKSILRGNRDVELMPTQPERSCAELSLDTTPRSVAALRGGWATSNRSAFVVVVVGGGQSGENTTTPRSFSRLGPSGRRCRSRLVIQIKGIGQSVPQK